VRSLLLALSCLLVPLAAEAQDVSAADARAIR